ncbi:TonB family protein [Hymenobacter sp. ASUV-10]|uniref:TonB family protein n=1 Tax=Hymenobacter aranciens TaxID=3063996 RepID=A0ABT9BBH5_9BACT|nr:energy transducer TonB [Hymenobacter sp. ASUV-10]MDO7873898.1 TonB family protein [Hymenobacter sp. ASUV-10]
MKDLKVKATIAALTVCLFAAIPHVSLAQAGTPPVARPAKRVLYMSKKGELVASPDSADHREELVYRDSVGGVARIYYPSGKLRRTVPYVHFDRGIRYGEELGFYETGEIKSRRSYKLYEPVGEALTYYRSGAVRSRTTYETNGKSKTEYLTPEGQPRPAPDIKTEKMPVFQNGGYKEMVAQIQRRVKYPIEALRQQIGGKVEVSFTVDETGFIRHIHIVKSPSPILNETVMQAVASLGRLIPGEEDGEPVDVVFTVPVTFQVE